jgi:hypothetical protein
MSADDITRIIMSVAVAAVGGIWNAGMLILAFDLRSAGGEFYLPLLPTAGLAAAGAGVFFSLRSRSIVPLGWWGLASVLLGAPWLFSALY